MPCTSLSSASCDKKVLLSTGLVGSWFCSCASIRVKKSVPPSVPSPAALEEDPLVPVDPVVPVVPVVPTVPVFPVVLVGVEAASIEWMIMINVPSQLS